MKFVNLTTKIFKLICILSLFTPTISSPTTEADMGIWRQDTSFPNGVFSMQRYISFRTNFSSRPRVAVGLVTFDMDRVSPGMDVSVTSVNTSGFNVTISRGYSALYAVDFSWIAVNDPKVGIFTYSQGSISQVATAFTSAVNSGNGYLAIDYNISVFGFKQPNASVMLNGYGFTTANNNGVVDGSQNRGFEITAYPKSSNVLTVVVRAYNKITITGVNSLQILNTKNPDVLSLITLYN